jgi:hypothetical protein
VSCTALRGAQLLSGITKAGKRAGVRSHAHFGLSVAPSFRSTCLLFCLARWMEQASARAELSFL